MRPGFVPYDFSEVFDLEAMLQRLPPGLTQRGMFLNGLLDEAIRQGSPLPNKRRYTAFKEYSLEEGFRLSYAVSQHLYPEVSAKEGFRRLGHTMFPTLLNSMIGRALFGVVGRKIDAVMRLVPKGFAVSANEAEVKLLECSARESLFCFRSFPGFELSFDIGILEGIVLFYQQTPTCLTRRSSPSEAEILCSWE